MSFVFYDTETTGIDTAFDQILQFGAIRTDADLNEIDRFEIRCRLLPEIVPSPGAMLVTGVSAKQLTDPSLPSHYEMVCEIRAKLGSWSPSIFIGHNSLGFDEHLLRQALYKTLHSPYLTNTNGNGRSDSLKMLRAASVFAPDAVEIPVGSNGRKVFKLDQLAPLNGFAHENAHDAMADVEATIHMCRLVAERAPALWQNFVRLAHKPSALDFALNEAAYCVTDFHYGQSYSRPVSPIGTNPDNGSEVLVFDLSVDPAELAQLDDEQLGKRLDKSPRPVRSIRANTAPVLNELADAPEDIRSGWPEPEEVEERAGLISADKALRERLVATTLEKREPFPAAEYIEQRIYDGFPSWNDNQLMERFHQADWPERISILSRFEDERLKALARRLAYSEAPALMTDTDRRDQELEIAGRLVAAQDDVPWTTIAGALAEAGNKLKEADPETSVFIEEHIDLLKQRQQWAVEVQG
ncbi:exonuclease domain-containing protein [Altererythrobacter rubellus]|uniref:Exodeoxyribonuclease I n=1 Tax=Altererythrobacter rubellus TaxID=2173831 RepID=A0A9Y2B2E0_9SPHN|nr:exonuclease domain-containing protein [Altererythrobacter rubellus]WIW95462.1 exonuclease domain-containing protein [Altererythrobacter rubellus]